LIGDRAKPIPIAAALLLLEETPGKSSTFSAALSIKPTVPRAVYALRLNPKKKRIVQLIVFD
jgi:hypothetical protein